MHLGLDPVHGEGDEAHAHARVEALHGLHEADVAFLDQVAQGQAIAHVAAGHVHHETQVMQHQLAGRLQVLLVVEAQGELALLLGAQHRDGMHRLDIGIQAADRAHGQVAAQGCGCGCVVIMALLFMGLF